MGHMPWSPASLQPLQHDARGVPTVDGELQQRLLGVARAVVETGARRGGRPPIPDVESTTRPAPLFVTLRDAQGGLRGCVGHVEARCRSLEDEVASCAWAAAFGDPRFEPLRPDELQGLTLDITLLGPMEQVAGPEALDPSRYGVVVMGRGGRRGVLLPNVEGVETAREQVDIAARKAGLFPGEDVTLHRFSAVKFGEA